MANRSRFRESIPCLRRTSCLAHAGTHAKGRSHALCLQMIRIGQAIGRNRNMGADYPTHWGQTTKRHLEVLQLVGDTGEVQPPDERRPRRRVGSQKAHSTHLNLRFGKGKALETPVIGKRPRYLLGLSGSNSTQLIKATPTDIRLNVTNMVRYAVCSLLGLWIFSYEKSEEQAGKAASKVL